MNLSTPFLIAVLLAPQGTFYLTTKQPIGSRASYQAEMNHFAKDGLAFSYPAGWVLTDNSTDDAQRLLIARKGSSIQIMIVARRGITLSVKLEAATQTLKAQSISEVRSRLRTQENPGESTALKVQVGAVTAEGVRLHFTSGKNSYTGDFYSLRRGLRVINVVLVAADKDKSEEIAAWNSILSSLTVEPPLIGVMVAEPEHDPTYVTEHADQFTGGVLNGQALELPKPAYSALARQAHIGGTVTVQVLINEHGDVVDAAAVSGHPLLATPCVAAAKLAKFSPTLLEGEPVKVTGVIQYNFVVQ